MQCLQPAPTSRLHKHLKILNEVNNSTVNFGGTPKGGVPKALKQVLAALASDHIVHFKSDIAAFFTKVPHAYVIDVILAETGDIQFVETLKKALSVQLKNADQLKEYLDLFPDDEFGMPQGSALSAIAGNIFLEDVDREMKNLQGIRFVRYIDDVIILAKSNENLQRAKSKLAKELKKRSLSLYDPAKDPDKAAEGHTRQGFEYLGCLIQKNQLEPGKDTKMKIIGKVASEIARTKSNIEKFLKDEKCKRAREVTFAKALANIDETVRGWANSFRFVNSRRPFAQIDSEIRKQVDEFQKWFAAQKPASEIRRMRALGVFQLIDTEYKKIEDY